jgi:predicted O-linked N-acetylglucosamine transferase (SPINDLY family)
VTLPRDLAQARTLVAARGLDALLYPDVGMDPMSYFLTFARLARVQCTTWGHPVTTGVPAIDYFVSTDYFEPDEAQHHYSETLVRLTDVAFPGYYYRPQLPATSSSGAPGFDRGRRVYFCPQTLYKIHPAFDAALAAILRRDPRGEVVIVYDEEADRYRLPQLKARLQRSAPDVADRIVFLPRTANREGYLQRLRAADVVLDTFPYCGGNTSLEAISADALVVTLPSELNRGRHTYGFFRKMRFTDTVAASAEEYAELAVKIAADADLRMHLKHVQAERCGALYEDASAVRQMEAFFERALAASGRP